MDWGKLGQKQGVYNIKKIDNLSSEDFYFYGEWNMSLNVPTGRCFLYVKG